MINLIPLPKQASRTGATLERAPDAGHRPVAILTWGLRAGAFANLCPALAGGIHATGGGPVDLLYLWAEPGETVQIPPGVRLVRLGVRRAAFVPAALRRYLRRTRPRVLITMPSMMTLPALLAYRLAGSRVRRDTRFVAHQGDTLSNDIDIDHARLSPLRLMPMLARRMYRWADGVTASAPGVIPLLKNDEVPLPGGRAVIIGNPVDVEACRLAAAAEPAHPWIVNKTGPVITTLGRLVKRKNHELLLNAVVELRQLGIETRLIIFGDGPERSAIEAAAEQLGLASSVSVAGFVANPFADIGRSDAFVMSSVDEAFCLALVEAMACGVPVVSTDAVGGGPRYVLTGDGEDESPPDVEILRRVLTPSGDLAALTTAMHEVLTDPDFRDAVTSAARDRAAEFGPNRIGSRWATYIDSICAARRTEEDGLNVIVSCREYGSRLKRLTAGFVNSRRSTEQVFTNIYEKNKWGGTRGDFCSGSGSDRGPADPYVELVGALVAEASAARDIRVLDLGCGDFRIGSRIAPLVGHYHGVDVVRPLIERNTAQYGSSTVSFSHLDIVADELPEADICLVRQVLQHLSNDQIARVLPKLRRYATVLVTEHYPHAGPVARANLDKVQGADVRVYHDSGVYLSEPPFDVPADELRTVLDVPVRPLTAASQPGCLRTILYEPGRST